MLPLQVQLPADLSDFASLDRGCRPGLFASPIAELLDLRFRGFAHRVDNLCSFEDVRRVDLAGIFSERGKQGSRYKLGDLRTREAFSMPGNLFQIDLDLLAAVDLKRDLHDRHPFGRSR